MNKDEYIAMRSNKMGSITRCTRRWRSYCRNSSSVSCVMTSPPMHGTQVRSTCLSVAVRSHISKTTVRTSRSFMHANCDHGSVLQQSKQLMLCRSTCKVNGRLGSRVVSVLDSGAVGHRFKWQPRRCRVTVLGKLFTPIVPLFT